MVFSADCDNIFHFVAEDEGSLRSSLRIYVVLKRVCDLLTAIPSPLPAAMLVGGWWYLKQKNTASQANIASLNSVGCIYGIKESQNKSMKY